MFFLDSAIPEKNSNLNILIFIKIVQYDIYGHSSRICTPCTSGSRINSCIIYHRAVII